MKYAIRIIEVTRIMYTIYISISREFRESIRFSMIKNGNEKAVPITNPITIKKII